MRLPENLESRFQVAVGGFLERLRVELQDGFEAYLLGSLARGDYTLDIDITIVTDRLAEMKPWERSAYLRRLTPQNVGFDIICHTKKEFKERETPTAAKKVTQPNHNTQIKSPGSRPLHRQCPRWKR